MMLPWDIFISHAREDKSRFVDPLANRLQKLAVRVWYDKFVLAPGDRLSEKIAEGLAKSRCGLLVLSPSFLSKPWPSYELSGLINRFVEEKTRLIPIWLGVSRQDIANFNPSLADVYAIQGNVNNIEDCALEILRVVRPQLYDNMKIKAKLGLMPIEIKRIPVSSISTEGPIRHHDLPDKLLIRIQNIWFATRTLSPISLSDMIKNFQKDLSPEEEVVVWERIISATQVAMDIMQSTNEEIKKQIFSILMSFSVGNHESVFNDTENGKRTMSVFEAAAEAWLKVVPKVTILDVDKDDV